jgi:hypothetical protein
MNTTTIKILIQKYEAGETSLSEEALLKQYFASGAVDPSLRHYAPLFTFFKAEQEVKADEKLEAEILNKLDAHRTIPLYKSRTFWTWASGIAASVVLVFSLIFELQQSNVQKPQAQSQAEIQKAYEQTKIALAYMSDKYNQGTEPLNMVAKLEYSSQTMNQLSKMNTGMNEVNKQIKKMDKGVGQITKLSKFSIVVKP